MLNPSRVVWLIYVRCMVQVDVKDVEHIERKTTDECEFTGEWEEVTKEEVNGEEVNGEEVTGELIEMLDR